MGSRVCNELGPMLLESGKKVEKKSLEKRGPVLVCYAGLAYAPFQLTPDRQFKLLVYGKR